MPVTAEPLISMNPFAVGVAAGTMAPHRNAMIILLITHFQLAIGSFNLLFGDKLLRQCTVDAL